MSERSESWFDVRPSGYGLTPRTWQGWCTTLIIMVVLLASVQVVLSLERDPLSAVILILIVTVVELGVFIPFTYRHARSPADIERAEMEILAEKREKIQKDLAEWKKQNGL